MIDIPKKAKAHTVYKNKDGQRLPGVTTITGQLDKPALIKWANNLGLQGIDSAKYTDHLAEIGTLAHDMTACYLRGVECDTSEYTTKQIDQAENSCLSFYEWEKDSKLEPILIEQPLVSEEYQFGGTIDFYGKCNIAQELIDLKTGKAIYPEMWYQVAGYRILLREQGYKVDGCRILRIGRDETEGFDDPVKADTTIQEQIFLSLLELYNLKKLERRG